MARRFLPMIAILAAILHGVGMARSPLPAQDGLKFLRVARDFHHRPWGQVVRSSDQHPLYPAMIALVQPIVATMTGEGADSWRLAAQVVSALASLAMLIPLYSLSRSIAGEPGAILATLLYVLLPLPAAMGHDTLSDPLSLLMFVTAFAFGEKSLREHRLDAAILCGVASGLGFLTRPEVAIVPLTMAIGYVLMSGRWTGVASRPTVRNLAGLSVAFLVMVGSYAVVKGEVSEKLALRRAIAIPSQHDQPTKTVIALPPGLDDPRWDFAAKEESDQAAGMTLLEASGRFVSRYGEAMGYLLVPIMLFGVACVTRTAASRLAAIYAVVFSALLVRHAMTFGYLSARHTMTLVVLSLPFASAGILQIVQRVRDRQNQRGDVSSRGRTIRRVLAVAALMTLAIGVQLHHAPHPSRWGHGEAGRWLAEHATEAESVLDTRGWATFVSGRAGHDYWHVKQALTDPSLAYVVVGEDERTAESHRGETLRAVLAYAAEPLVEFPEREGGSNVGVRLYRFHPPRSWKGLQP